MTQWIETTIDKLSEFIRKHSIIFKADSRILNKDALITTSQLYAILQEMKEREEFDFIEDEFIENILKRVVWIFRQLLVDYRINYREYLKFKDDNNRFFTISPTGEVNVDQRIYNIPKHLDEIGVYPDLSTGLWIKEIEYGERKWDR